MPTPIKNQLKMAAYVGEEQAAWLEAERERGNYRSVSAVIRALIDKARNNQVARERRTRREW